MIIKNIFLYNSHMKKYILLLSSLISIGMIIPLFFIYQRLKHASTLLSADSAEPNVIDGILGYSIKTPNLLIPFIFLIIFLIAQAIIATYLLTKGKTRQEKVFGYLTFIIGGLGINSLYFLITTLMHREHSYGSRVSKKWVNIGVTATIPFVVIPPILLFAIYKGIDAPTQVKNVVYSTNKQYQNVIEIFTDGFDPTNMLDNIKKNDKYDDFDVYPNTMTSGAETAFSFPTIMEGLKKGNIFNQYDTKSNASLSSMTDIYAKVFGESIKNHLGSPVNNGTSFGKYLLNTNGIMRKGSFAASMSGEPDFMHTIAPTVQSVNWGQVRQDLAGGIGTMHESPDHGFYSWHNKKAIANDKATYGTRMLLQEFSTHSPRIASASGGVTFATGTKDGHDITLTETAKGLDHSLTNLIKRLKSLKGPSGLSVYDNSMVVVYGDHANHSTPLIHKDNKVNGHKYHSMFMVKYPKQNYATHAYPIRTNHSNINFTNEVYTPFINKIVQNIDDPKYIQQNKNFAKDNIHLGFYGKEGVFMKFDSNHELQRISTELDLGNNISTDKGFITFDQYKKLANNKPTRQKIFLAKVEWDHA